MTPTPMCRQSTSTSTMWVSSLFFGNLELELTQKVDLIVSNPPYVAADDKHLSEGDVRFEPKSALISEESGLADIRQVITQSYQQLSAGGWLLLEHGYNQAKAVFELLQDQGFSECFVKRDIGGHERVSGGRK